MTLAMGMAAAKADIAGSTMEGIVGEASAGCTAALVDRIVAILREWIALALMSLIV